jgi:hypothetical protein
MRCGVVFAVMLAVLGGCKHTVKPKPATAPAGPTFVDPEHGFEVAVPKGWTQKKSVGPEDVLTLADDKGAELAIAVPKLPPHLPGIIPLPAVEKGYVDDVRKRLSDVTEPESGAIRVADAFARRFAITGTDETGPRKLLAVAIVKGDRLYIITGDGPADQYENVRKGVEATIASWSWIK